MTLKNNKPEHYEQVTFFDWVRLNRQHASNEEVKEAMELCYAVPNGANLPKKKYKNKNGEWKTWSSEAKWLKEEGALEPGVPDINLDHPAWVRYDDNGGLQDIVPNIFMGLRIEMKFGDGKLSPEQKRKKYLLEKVGYKVEICYSAVEAIRAVYEYLPFDADDYQGIKEYL